MWGGTAESQSLIGEYGGKPVDLVRNEASERISERRRVEDRSTSSSMHIIAS